MWYKVEISAGGIVWVSEHLQYCHVGVLRNRSDQLDENELFVEIILILLIIPFDNWLSRVAFRLTEVKNQINDRQIKFKRHAWNRKIGDFNVCWFSFWYWVSIVIWYKNSSFDKIATQWNIHRCNYTGSLAYLGPICVIDMHFIPLCVLTHIHSHTDKQISGPLHYKVKGSPYIAYPVLRTAQSTFHFTSLTDLFNQTPSRLLWEASSHMLQLMREGWSYTYPPLSIARYSFIQLSEMEQCRVKTTCPRF